MEEPIGQRLWRPHITSGIEATSLLKALSAPAGERPALPNSTRIWLSDLTIAELMVLRGMVGSKTSMNDGLLGNLVHPRVDGLATLRKVLINSAGTITQTNPESKQRDLNSIDYANFAETLKQYIGTIRQRNAEGGGGPNDPTSSTDILSKKRLLQNFGIPLPSLDLLENSDDQQLCVLAKSLEQNTEPSTFSVVPKMIHGAIKKPNAITNIGQLCADIAAALAQAGMGVDISPPI
jgi:hypothetical protein